MRSIRDQIEINKRARDQLEINKRSIRYKFDISMRPIRDKSDVNQRSIRYHEIGIETTLEIEIEIWIEIELEIEIEIFGAAGAAFSRLPPRGFRERPNISHTTSASLPGPKLNKLRATASAPGPADSSHQVQQQQQHQWRQQEQQQQQQWQQQQHRQQADIQNWTTPNKLARSNQGSKANEQNNSIYTKNKINNKINKITQTNKQAIKTAKQANKQKTTKKNNNGALGPGRALGLQRPGARARCPGLCRASRQVRVVVLIQIWVFGCVFTYLFVCVRVDLIRWLFLCCCLFFCVCLFFSKWTDRFSLL